MAKMTIWPTALPDNDLMNRLTMTSPPYTILCLFTVLKIRVWGRSFDLAQIPFPKTHCVRHPYEEHKLAPRQDSRIGLEYSTTTRAAQQINPFPGSSPRIQIA